MGNPHKEDTTKKHMEDEGDEFDLDQVHSVVKRMVGMRVSESGHGEWGWCKYASLSNGMDV